MKRQPLFYTLKVWLWSATISPVIAAALQFYYYHGDLKKVDFLTIYPIILVVEVLLTFLIWLLFWAINAICSNIIANDNTYRLAASTIGLIIAASLCWLTRDSNMPLFEDPPFDVAFANCLCIFAGCWYFDIGKSAPNTDSPFINTNTYEQATE
jgi:membrane protease YdiL (CAAX protease family)